MSWDTIVNQHRVKALLSAALERGQLAHALLFTGPDGTGKEAMAIELAKVLNCSRGGAAACDECPDCRNAAALRHPNINLIYPLPVGKNEAAGDPPLAKLAPAEIESIQQQLAVKAANPYAKMAVPRATVIKVNSIREIRRSASLSAFSGGKKVYAIFDAGKMNDEAANALLKTLEEPLADTVIILCAATPDELLPTVVSRCQRLRFDLLPEQEIQNALVRREQVEPDRAALIAALSRGSYRQALDLLDVDIQAYREDLVSFLRTLLYRSRREIFDAVDALGSARDRQEVIRLLTVMQAWFHESLALRTGSATLAVLHDETLKKFTEAHPHIQYPAVARCLDEAISLVSKNVYIPLLLTVLAFEIQQLVLSPTRTHS